ncbi:hypothetical protein FRX31_023651 [Thalictrum thalictroides]|uniref:Uncharacterized protein n=1 Tax=Thalictrum thalictroides TaxID=46969 RepID=A0A7J6VPQ8_THATH|nr:hypothetical protein FRX31_023651 [Thalictrum thalictroides]
MSITSSSTWIRGNPNCEFLETVREKEISTPNSNKVQTPRFEEDEELEAAIIKKFGEGSLEKLRKLRSKGTNNTTQTGSCMEAGVLESIKEGNTDIEGSNGDNITDLERAPPSASTETLIHNVHDNQEIQEGVQVIFEPGTEHNVNEDENVHTGKEVIESDKTSDQDWQAPLPKHTANKQQDGSSS